MRPESTSHTHTFDWWSPLTTCGEEKVHRAYPHTLHGFELERSDTKPSVWGERREKAELPRG